jgi:hypothetical protein
MQRGNQLQQNEPPSNARVRGRTEWTCRWSSEMFGTWIQLGAQSHPGKQLPGKIKPEARSLVKSVFNGYTGPLLFLRTQLLSRSQSNESEMDVVKGRSRGRTRSTSFRMLQKLNKSASGHAKLCSDQRKHHATSNNAATGKYKYNFL